MKKNILLLTLLVLFCLCPKALKAYIYEDPKNETLVLEKINEIYSMREQYEDLIGGYEEVEIIDAGSNSYWWPIGSKETTIVNGKEFATGEPETVRITSKFGYRDDPFNRGRLFHSGLDIANNGSYGTTNIIAAKDGIVVYPTANIKNNCPSSGELSKCGGSYGNYVIIQHSDGNYTVYGHMYENSITVKAGDSVHQGQVIGKMGSSGASTGAHLHFEVREGANRYNATVDPLNYISSDEPRKSVSEEEGEFVLWLNSWEGHTPIDGDSYKVQRIGDGVTSVGHGVTLENTANYFAKYNINVNDYHAGDLMPIDIVDQVELDVIADKRSYIEGVISRNSITLEQTQIEALISYSFNTGNIRGFVDAYKAYGNTQEFYDNWFFKGLNKGSKFETGLTRRRNAEWALFNRGEYVYNS